MANYPTDGTIDVNLAQNGSTLTAMDGQPLLAEVQCNTGRFVKVSSATTISAYAAVKIDDDGVIAALTTALSGAEPTRVGVCQTDFNSTTLKYGWVWIGSGGGVGSGIKVTVAASCAADVKIGTTITAGTLDDSYTDLVQGLKIVTADGGSGSSIECYAAGEICTNAQD